MSSPEENEPHALPKPAQESCHSDHIAPAEDEAARKETEKAEREHDIFSRKLFIGNIGYRQNWKDLKDFCAKFGKVAYAQVVFDHLSRRSKGFGFVEFADKQGADNCLVATPEELTLEGRSLRISYAIESQKSTFTIHPPVPDLVNRDNLELVQEGEAELQVGKDTSQILRIDEWRVVFSFLTVCEQIRLERVCRKWREMALQIWKEKRVVICTGFSFKKLLTDKVLLSLLNRCGKSLRGLNLSTVSQVLTEYSMTIVGHHCPGLVRLDMSGVSATNIGMRDLSKRTAGLKWVKLRRCLHVAEKGLWWLFKNCDRLEHVDFAENSSITGKCFFMLNPHLRSMIANNCSKLTDYGFGELSKKCHHLRELHIHSCVSLTDDAIKAIATLSDLEVLDVGGQFPEATSEPWRLLGSLHKLTELRLDNPLVTDEAVEAVANGCPSLSVLSLRGCRPHVTVRGLLALTKLKCLTSLDLSYIQQVSDALLERLSSCCPLEHLFLHTCLEVTDAGIVCVLEQSGGLCTLDLSSNAGLMKRALLPLYSGSHAARQPPLQPLHIIIGGTTMLLEEEVPQTPRLETDLPGWVTLDRANRANRCFDQDDTLYLPDPWSDEEGEEEDDFRDLQGESYDEEEEEEGRGEGGGCIVGYGSDDGEGAYAMHGVAGALKAMDAGVQQKVGDHFSSEGGAEDKDDSSREAYNSPRRAEGREKERRIGDGVKGGAERSCCVSKGVGAAVPEEKNGTRMDKGGHLLAKEDMSFDRAGRDGGNVLEREDNLFDGGDSCAARSDEVEAETCANQLVESDELWEGEYVAPPPPRVHAPAAVPGPGLFLDVDDFDEDYDEFLINDDPLEMERWDMS